MQSDKLTHNQSHDQFPVPSLKERGMRLLEWELMKCNLKLAGAAAGSILFLYLWGSLVEFALPAMSVCLVALGGAGKFCWEVWRTRRRRVQELAVMRLIGPLVTAYRLGIEISKSDRSLLHQGREAILAQIARFREEQGEWRKRGRQDKGEDLAALLFELEDAKKLIDGEFGRAEQALRPAPKPRVELQRPPIGRRNSRSGLEKF